MGEGDDSQGDGRINPGRRRRPGQVEEGGISEGHPKRHGGLEKQEMPGSRHSGTLGEEMEAGLRGGWRPADQAVRGLGFRHPHAVEGGPHREEVVEDTKVEVHRQGVQGGHLQPRPDMVPREVGLDPGDTGGGGVSIISL